MSRPAIIVVLLVAVASVVLGTYYLIFPRVAEARLREQTTSLLLSGRLLQEMDVADEAHLCNKLVELSQRSSLRAILQEKTPDAGRENWLTRLRAEAEGLATTAHTAAPLQELFILNATGIGLVRTNDPRWTGQQPSEDQRIVDLIRQAQRGATQATLSISSNTLVRTIAVPVLSGDAVLGMLVALFPLDEVVANARSGELGLGFYFAYVSTDGVLTSTLDPTALATLQVFLQGHREMIEDLLNGKSVDLHTVATRSSNLQILGLPSTADRGQSRVALVVLREIEAETKLLGTFGLWLSGIAGVVLVIMVVGVALLGGSLARGVKRLEQDARMITSGSLKHTFNVSGPSVVRSLAALLNQLRIPHEEEKAGVESQEPTAHEAHGADTEPEDEKTQYYRDLFNEFVRAKQKVGEGTKRLEFKRFQTKLLKQEEVLKTKHGCNAVRFEVTMSANQVKLRPRFIRDSDSTHGGSAANE